MALNSDFKVKDSLYVGNSACFVTQTNTPVILSAGASLFDIFLQEGESGSGVLSDGDGITDFMFNSLSAATVAVDGTVVRTTGDQSIAGVKSFSDDLVVDTNTLFVDASTNTVGIGTSSPTSTYKLDVVGGIKSSQFIDVENQYGLRIKDTGGNISCAVQLNNSDELVIGHTSTTIPTRVIGDYITLESTNFLGVPVEAVRVIDGGNVGIGTTTPGAKLTVNGGTCTTGLSATAANSGILSAGKDLNTLFSNCQGTVTSVTGGNGIDSSGGTTPQISISGGDGITSSSQDIHVDTTVIRTTGGQTIAGCTTFGDYIDVGSGIRHEGDNNTFINFTDDAIYVRAGNCDNLRINTTGAVFNEFSKDLDFRVEGDTDTHAIFVQGSSSNVGIGTSTPGAKLTVNGGTCTTGLSATAANSGILSAGKDLNEIFQIIGSDARGKVLSDGIGIQDFTYEGLSAQTVAVSQSILSGGASHAQGTLTLSGAGGTGYNTTIDLGLQAADNPTFAGVTGGNVRVGITADGEIDTSSGNLTIDSAGGTTILDDANISIGNVGAGSSNTVVVKSGSNLATDEIDPKVWDIKLVDYGTLGQCGIPVATDSTGTVGDSIMEQKAAGGGFDVTGINVLGGLSAVSLSGDGAGLTNVTATAIFPTTTKTALVGGDKFFINDSANKHTTYTTLLTSFGGGAGLTTNGTCLAVAGASSLTSGKITKWNGTCFINSIMTETALGNISIAGGATITGNLSVQGELTCIDTTVSVTSALSVVNAGTGPAIFARQTGTDEPIARFVDTEGGFITFDDGGSVGIGIDSPAAKLDVVGDAHISTNLTVDGNTQLGNASSDTITIDSAGICTPCLAAGTGTSVLVRGSTSDGIVTHDVVDSKIFGTLLVDGEGSANKLPKYTNGTGTIGDSVITDTGSLVTIDSNTKIDEGHSFQVFAPADPLGASLDSYSQKQTFSTIVTSASSHPVNTFCKTNLKQVKYNVTFIKGVNITSFEVNAVNNNTTTIGTVYGIVDGQAATQLDTASICNSTDHVTLLLKSASAGTCAVITGEALYAS